MQARSGWSCRRLGAAGGRGGGAGRHCQGLVARGEGSREPDDGDRRRAWPIPQFGSPGGLVPAQRRTKEEKSDAEAVLNATRLDRAQPASQLSVEDSGAWHRGACIVSGGGRRAPSAAEQRRCTANLAASCDSAAMCDPCRTLPGYSALVHGGNVVHFVAPLTGRRVSDCGSRRHVGTVSECDKCVSTLSNLRGARSA